MVEDRYKETFELLIVILAIIAFMVATTDYLIWKKKPNLPDQSIEGIENVRQRMNEIFVNVGSAFIIIFF